MATIQEAGHCLLLSQSLIEWTLDSVWKCNVQTLPFPLFIYDVNWKSCVCVYVCACVCVCARLCAWVVNCSSLITQKKLHRSLWNSAWVFVYVFKNPINFGYDQSKMVDFRLYYHSWLIWTKCMFIQISRDHCEIYIWENHR